MDDTPKSTVDVPVEQGKVQGVRMQFLLEGDKGYAHRLQNEEYDKLYEKNREERQTARQDVPVARTVQTEEEKQLQRKELRRLESLKSTSDADEVYAHQISKQESIEKNEEIFGEEDIQLARQIQHAEMAQLQSIDDDARYAMELQRKELISQKRERLKREAEDMSYAQKLHNSERRLAELWRVERQLQDCYRGRTPQQEPDNQDDAYQVQYTRRVMRISSVDDEPDDDLLDTEEQQMQKDREMARALQKLELEQKRASQNYDIESGDARLARILQEKERLKALKHREQKRIQRAQRERERLMLERQSGVSGVRQPPPYDSGPPHYGYDEPSSLTASLPPAPAPPPPPPLPADDRFRRRQTDQSPPASTSAKSLHSPPASSNRPARPPPPSQSSLDERRRYEDGRQRDDAGRVPVNGPLYIGPMGHSMLLSGPHSTRGDQGSSSPLRQAVTSPQDYNY